MTQLTFDIYMYVDPTKLYLSFFHQNKHKIDPKYHFASCLEFWELSFAPVFLNPICQRVPITAHPPSKIKFRAIFGGFLQYQPKHIQNCGLHGKNQVRNFKNRKMATINPISIGGGPRRPGQFYFLNYSLMVNVRVPKLVDFS